MMSTQGVPQFSMPFQCIYVRKPLDFSEHTWQVYTYQAIFHVKQQVCIQFNLYSVGRIQSSVSKKKNLW